MAQIWARKFYNSKAWKKCREMYKQSRYGLCERCLRKGKYNAGEEVHHKIWLTPNNINDHGITLSFTNLELLCASCHTYEHVGRFSPTVEGLTFNSNGELVKAESVIHKGNTYEGKMEGLTLYPPCLKMEAERAIPSVQSRSNAQDIFI